MVLFNLLHTRNFVKLLSILGLKKVEIILIQLIIYWLVSEPFFFILSPNKLHPVEVVSMHLYYSDFPNNDQEENEKFWPGIDSKLGIFSCILVFRIQWTMQY